MWPLTFKDLCLIWSSFLHIMQNKCATQKFQVLNNYWVFLSGVTKIFHLAFLQVCDSHLQQDFQLLGNFIYLLTVYRFLPSANFVHIAYCLIFHISPENPFLLYDWNYSSFFILPFLLYHHLLLPYNLDSHFTVCFHLLSFMSPKIS